MWATYLVVVETDALGRVARPIGVLTDRDLVLTLLARDVIPSAVSVGDVMTANPVTIRDSDSIEDALQKMRARGSSHAGRRRAWRSHGSVVHGWHPQGTRLGHGGPRDDQRG